MSERTVEPNVRQYRVVHRTTYRYELPMTDGYTVAHLLPRDTPRQRVAESVVDVTPEPSRATSTSTRSATASRSSVCTIRTTSSSSKR